MAGRVSRSDDVAESSGTGELSLAEDSGERRTAVTRLRPEDLGVGLLFWAVRDAVIIGEVESGRIALWNPSAARLFGYTEDEAIGMPIEALVPEHLKLQHRIGLAQYAATGKGAIIDATDPIELPAVRKAGEQITIELWLAALSPMPNMPYRYVLATVRDATARVRLAEERAQLLSAAQAYATQLEALARLRADFSEMVAHEFVAPLDAIRTIADLFAQSAVPLEQQASLAASISEEVTLLQQLAQDAAAAARAERDDAAVVPVPVPAAALIEDVAAFAATLSADHPVTVEVCPNVTVLADPARIGQVLRNLTENAIKHTPPGTRITLRATPHTDGVRIEVADHGPGVHVEDMRRIFEKFGRGRDAAGRGIPGVGLGLYLARRIVRAHGSELTVQATPGDGCVFMFDLKAG